MLTSRQKSGRSVRTVSLTARGHRFSFRSSASTPLSSNVHFEMSLPTSSVKEELLKKIRRRAEELGEQEGRR
jgi:hypothetical protein